MSSAKQHGSTIAVIGAGVMGETFVGGLIRAGIPADRIVIAEKVAEREQQVQDTHGVAAADPAQAVIGADTVLLAVKPQDARQALSVIGPHIEPGAALISLAAGISTDDLQSYVGDQVTCLRAMPNTPAVIGEGMTVISAGAKADPATVERVRDMLSVLGSTAAVDERLQDAVTAISGSGPAYVFAFMESLEAAGIELGLDPEVARLLVLQTVAGAALLARGSDVDPAELRRRVTSPGGTTQAALAVLTGGDRPEQGWAPLIAAATRAARDRGAELGREA